MRYLLIQIGTKPVYYYVNIMNYLNLLPKMFIKIILIFKYNFIVNFIVSFSSVSFIIRT